METVLSGIRSTGRLHLGNYFGALRNFVKMQHTDRCFFFIADYHSLTTHPDPKALHGNVKNVLAEYLAAGPRSRGGDDLISRATCRRWPSCRCC